MRHILPACIYKQVTGDTLICNLKPCTKVIVSYTAEHRKITGRLNSPIWSGGLWKSLDFNIIEGDFQPVLSLHTSIGLGLVNLHNCNVLALKVDSPSSIPPEEFPDVFEGQGVPPGKYQIVLNRNIPPCLNIPTLISRIHTFVSDTLTNHLRSIKKQTFLKVYNLLCVFLLAWASVP